MVGGRDTCGPLVSHKTIHVKIRVNFDTMTSSNGDIFRVTSYWPFVRGIHRSPVNCPHKRPVTRSFDVFFDLRPNKRLSKQWRGWWFETQSCSSCKFRIVGFWIVGCLLPTNRKSRLKFLLTNMDFNMKFISWKSHRSRRVSELTLEIPDFDLRSVCHSVPSVCQNIQQALWRIYILHLLNKCHVFMICFLCDCMRYLCPFQYMRKLHMLPDGSHGFNN